MSPIATHPGSDINGAASRERPQTIHLRTMHLASPLTVGPSRSDLRSERWGSLQPSTPRASSTAVFSSSSARNRHHEPMASTSPVPVQASTLVINNLDLQSAPHSVLVVIIPETTVNQPTSVPEAQHAMHEATQGLTDSDPCQPPTSLPVIMEIRVAGESPALLQRPMPTINTGETNHSRLVGLPPENSTSRPSP